MSFTNIQELVNEFVDWARKNNAGMGVFNVISWLINHKGYKPPEKKKPLTLEELFPGGIERSPDVVWIEFKGQHSLDVWKPAYSGEDFINWFNQINYEKDRYNKTWRCWASKPTDEERKAAPWGE